MNAESPRNPFNALLRRRITPMKVTLDGQEYDLEIREQPIKIVQPIIDKIGTSGSTEFLYDLMEVSFYFRMGEREGSPLFQTFKDMGVNIREATVSALADLEPATKEMLRTYGLEQPAVPGDEKKESEGDSPPSSAPSSS